MPNKTRSQLCRYATGALIAGVLAGGSAYGLPHLREPVTLPASISAEHPVRVVSTVLDQRGRPVVTVRTATDRDAAADLVDHGRRAERSVGVEIDVPMTAAGADPYRDSQWDLAQVRAADAWPTSTGAGVVVAVLDTGVDATHPDLAGQVLPGADLVTGSGDAGEDLNGHGTHVAGVIAALTGNDLGVSSIAPDAKILPVRVLDANGAGYLSTAAAGIVYAADHGAGVINMSIAARSSQASVTSAVAYARAKGVVVVAAAGNERALGSPPSYPAAEPGVIAVSATDPGGAVAGFSTAGDYVDVAAPGTDILSTFPVAKGYDFAYSSGTSMASPHVAAVAALLKAADRTLTPDQIEQAIENSATDLGPPGRDSDFGHGRIDAAAALAALAPAPAPALAESPAAIPEIPTPASESPETVTPSAGPETVTPSAGPEAVTPSAGPETATPPAGSEAATPSEGAEGPTPSGSPETVSPSAGSGVATPTAGPGTAAPTTAGPETAPRTPAIGESAE